MRKVVKFGGSSLASAEQFEKVGKIIRADRSRAYVVPSAPGKRFPEDIKVTDMLYTCYAAAARRDSIDRRLEEIQDRYQGIIAGLGLELSLEEEFAEIRKRFLEQCGEDYAASRGEYLNGIIMANYLGFTFIDAAEVIRFHEDGSFAAQETYDLVAKRLENCENAVIPGFYGAYADGRIEDIFKRRIRHYRIDRGKSYRGGSL